MFTFVSRNLEASTIFMFEFNRYSGFRKIFPAPRFLECMSIFATEYKLITPLFIALQQIKRIFITANQIIDNTCWKLPNWTKPCMLNKTQLCLTINSPRIPSYQNFLTTRIWITITKPVKIMSKEMYREPGFVSQRYERNLYPDRYRFRIDVYNSTKPVWITIQFGFRVQRAAVARF